MKDDWDNDVLLYFDINEEIYGYVQILIDGKTVGALSLSQFDFIDENRYRSVPITFNNLTVSEWKAGEYNGKVIIYAQSMHSPEPEEVFSDVFSFTLYDAQIVKNENVTIEINPVPTIISDNDTLVIITAKDNTSNVVIYVNDSQTPITLPLLDCRYDENVGCFIIGSKELNLGAGKYKLKVSYPGEGENALNLTGNVTLVTSSIVVEDVVFDYGGTGIANFTVEHGSVDLANITVLDSNGKAVSDVKITLDGNKIIISNLNAGEYTLKVVITPEEYYLPQTGLAKITVNKLKTVLIANAITTTYDVNKYLVITLKDSKGNPLSGASVSVNLNGAKTYVTDKNGQIKIAVGSLVPKTYNVKITFDGDALYLKSIKEVKVTVKKAKPKLIAKAKKFKKSLKTKKYAVTLKANTGKAIKKVKLTLKVKGKTYKAKTNAKGKATFKIKKLTKKGTFKAKITFNGNKYYSKITKQVKIKIK